ncbi:MAG: RNA polymerase sigma factor [bacterium]
MSKNYANQENIRELIQDMIEGDDDAWTFFVEKYGRLIFYCINRTFKKMGIEARQESIEDCYQRVIISLLEDNYRKLRGFHSNDRKVFCSWIGIMSNRQVIDFTRTAWEKKRSYLDDNIWSLVTDTKVSIDTELLSNQLQRGIEALLEGSERLVLRLIIEGYTLSEIAGLLKQSTSTIHNWKTNGIEKLRKNLGEMC